MRKQFIILSSVTLLFLFSCGRRTTTSTTDIDTLNKDILNSIAHNVCSGSYTEMYNRALTLENAVLALQTNTNETNLTACKTAWKEMRFTWETTESWLFGPISANNIDPRIDTWPVDFTAIDSVLNTANPLTESYIDNLEDALKGFHPTEYFLWGANGNKTAADFTARQLEYLVALTHNLSKLSKEVDDTWKGSYAEELATAGNGSAAYATKTSAYMEIVDAMAGICDEVANGKINDPFIAQDPMLEESPFAKNSIKDFTQNIQGVLVIYQGNFNGDKYGIEDLVREYNTSLDQDVKSAHAAAIAALNNITLPFGEAIISQPIMVQNAIDKINALAEVLDTKLKPFLQQYGK